MRTAFMETLVELAEADERIFLLTADLGWTVVEKFAARFKDRFLNVGVAEANMAGIATGLAQADYVPFIYSIATFASMRCYEQVRNGPLLHGLPVRIVGTGGGYAYGHAGPTHYALEDLAIARTQPGMTVLVPADPQQTRNILRATLLLRGPAYLRVGKGGNPAVPGLNGRFSFGAPELVREGQGVLFIACGGIVHEALRAAEALEAEGLSAAVAVQAHLPGRPHPALAALLRKFRRVVSVEEGYAAGGLGSLVAETIAQEGLHSRLAICGVREPFSGVSGSESYMRAQAGLDAGSLAAAARTTTD
ncbi:MAG: transketolase C-terminal domain-containing protein [Planctomycetota bacterium]